MEGSFRYSLEDIWEALLSQEPDRIMTMFSDLDAQSRQFVVNHLFKMAKDEGWQIEQRISAEAALRVIRQENPH
jgi:hypothetical protein